MSKKNQEGGDRISRRTFIKGLGCLAAAPLLSGLGGYVAASPERALTPSGGSRYNTHVILLGTTGGPTWWPNSDRASASSALVVKDAGTNSDRVYLIDLGYGALDRVAQAFNSGTFVKMPGGRVQKGYSNYFSNVKALFFTHLHMDHTMDYPSLLLYGQGAGLTAYPEHEAEKRLQVYGPGTRGQLEDVYPPGRTNIAPIMNPDNPSPGTTDMTQYLLQAYAQTINNFTLDSGWGDFSNLVSLHEIPLPPLPRSDYPLDPQTGKPLNTAPWPDMEPIFVYGDSLVSVTAILVNHGPVYPAFAFRFDTPDGSVVFSGDTGYPCTNLIRLAQDADVLVHEVIDPGFIDNLFPQPIPDQYKPLKFHLESAHTMINDVGKHATEANVKTLVLNHIVPGNTPKARLMEAGRNFSGRMMIGSDLMRIGVGRASRRISG